jgi:heme/copper-type cytochrome/quinol oxidase subunit 3
MTTVPESVGDRNLAMGTRLWVAAEAFMFLAFLFAYFYLRTINSNGQWHPHGQNPSTGLGTATLVCLVISCAAYAAARRARSATGAPMVVALAAGLVALVLQIVQLVNPGFSPSHAGGYGSVFVGFTAMYVIHLTGATFWLETLIARARREVPDPAACAEQMIASADERHASFAVVWYATGCFYAIAYIMIYLL